VHLITDEYPEKMSRAMDRWIDGSMDRWIDGSIECKTPSSLVNAFAAVAAVLQMSAACNEPCVLSNTTARII
jgi:hypothetical protein